MTVDSATPSQPAPLSPVEPPSAAEVTRSIPTAPAPQLASRRSMRATAGVALIAVATSALLWQKLNNVQEQLARQSTDSGLQASEARASAKQAQELAMDTAAKLVLTETRLSEVSLQRSQLEELIQSLSRSRDENLVVDIESSLRLAQQQAQLTGSLEPLLAALKTAELRVQRAAQPRLTPVARAIARDLGRVKATALADTPALLVKLDELVVLADDLPAANAVALSKAAEPLKRQDEESVANWWLRALGIVRDEMRSLVRVTKIETPESALLSPEQTFFLRENLKLKLLNAKLGLLSRQIDSARSDLATAAHSLNRYFDTNSRKTQSATALLLQVQSQMRALELPRVDDTLAALSTTAAGR